ncbi:MAG: response regulator, partial [Bdellovibrionales bacterium]|nr:response regulator [Bdellovibrionales bacterium]
THSNPAAAKLKITRDTQYLNLLKLIPQLTLSDLEKCIEQNETISYTTCIGDYCFLIVLQGVASQRSGYAYATDITSQQAAETNLKKSKKFLRTIIDLDPNFIFVKDREGRFTLVNKAVADAYGTTPEKLVGKKDIDFNDQIQEVEHFREADIRVIVGNEELFIPEEEITDSGGNIRYLQTVKKPLRLSDEEESVVLGVSTDITKQKELQSQLFHAQKMEAVGQLAGGIAHDFNNLLTGILGYATLIKSKDLEDNEHFSIADKLIKAAERAAELTQKLLGFARKGKNQNIPINLHSIIEETVSMLDRIIEDNVRIKLDLSDFDPVIRGDPTQIQQVVLNLALNARDAMSESLGGTNGGVLNISTKFNKHNEEKYVVLTFEDTGCGIPKSIQSRIFEPFFTTKPNRRGTGMGLAMVYGIVENHGGKISIKSITGEGTSFEIVFPCVKSDQKIMTLKKENNFLKGKGSIMVVDDNQIVLSVTADMLKALGYKVETANNGWQAIKKYKVLKNEIDLLILDLVMPDLGAEETFLQLQKINPKIKVMLSTGYEASQSVQKVLDLGMVGFIQKPYEMSKLSKAISSVLTSAAFEQSA